MLFLLILIDYQEKKKLLEHKNEINLIIKNLFKLNFFFFKTQKPQKKKKALGSSKGYKARYKRVIITLKSGDAIPLLPETEKTN